MKTARFDCEMNTRFKSADHSTGCSSSCSSSKNNKVIMGVAAATSVFVLFALSLVVSGLVVRLMSLVSVVVIVGLMIRISHLILTADFDEPQAMLN